MLPLNSQKALFSGEEANVIRFALSIFLQTDFAGLTSKKEEEKAMAALCLFRVSCFYGWL